MVFADAISLQQQFSSFYKLGRNRQHRSTFSQIWLKKNGWQLPLLAGCHLFISTKTVEKLSVLENYNIKRVNEKSTCVCKEVILDRKWKTQECRELKIIIIKAFNVHKCVCMKNLCYQNYLCFFNENCFSFDLSWLVLSWNMP